MIIQWLSYTTSKVLPTFVGQSEITASASGKYTQQSGIDMMGLFHGAMTVSDVQSFTRNRTRTIMRWSWTGTQVLYSYDDAPGNTANPIPPEDRYIATGETNFGEAMVQSETFVNQNSTNKNGTVETGGTFKIRQQTTERQPAETINIRSTGISNVDVQYWTTTRIEDGTTFKTIPELKDGQVQSTVNSFGETVTEGIRVVDGVEEKTFTTYTATDGDVILVAHTIYEIHPQLNGWWRHQLAVSLDSPTETQFVTDLSYITSSRFTMSYSEEYTHTYPVRNDNLRTKGVTSRETHLEKNEPITTETTTVSYTSETYKQWQRSYPLQTRRCPGFTGETVYEYETYDDEGNAGVEYETIYDGIIYKKPDYTFYPANFGYTIQGNTKVSTTKETFETEMGRSDTQTTTTVNYTTTIGVTDFTKPNVKVTKTFYVNNNISESTTAEVISGDLLTWSSQAQPGLVQFDEGGDGLTFPYTSTGDEYKKYYFKRNNSTTSFSETTILKVFQHTWNIEHDESPEFMYLNAGYPLNDGNKSAWANKKLGNFYEKHIGFSEIHKIVSVIRNDNFGTRFGVANANLSYNTANTHSTVGLMLTANPQHTWTMEADGLAQISRGVVGAYPLTPTFRGIIDHDDDGWPVCDATGKTSVAGKRIGANFSTTIIYNVVQNSKTVQTTSSGSFTASTSIQQECGEVSAHLWNSVVFGGFETPNAARKEFWPGRVAALITTWDASNSGTSSTYNSSMKTEEFTKVGPVACTLSSFIKIYQGRKIIISNIDE